VGSVIQNKEKKMFEELMSVLKDDLTETYGYTESEAIAIIKEDGDSFVEMCISDMWDTWSNNFPYPMKGE